MTNNNQFEFEISLSVLNHLGRNLYRSFVTVLGEAISNAWDADAKNVWIEINTSESWFVIKDDGSGMDAEDFQDKFLKIGYSKRKDGSEKSAKGRPFIGRKGIGKLALLSCADKIMIISKRKKGRIYVGGLIDNKDLDKAITDDLKPDQYPLKPFDLNKLRRFTRGHSHGTIIRFEKIKGGVRNSMAQIKKVVALYFRFALVDRSFNIWIDGEKITYKNLKEIADKTEFLWKINNPDDPFVSKELHPVKTGKIKLPRGINGFIASVKVPRDLNIFTMDERVTVDLFVNGRLREKDILRHIPTARIVEDYLYGQIHYNALDEKKIDRFTSSREGVISDDTVYQEFLAKIKKDVLKIITEQWDEWRVANKTDGDPENPRLTKKDRKSRELFNAVTSGYVPPKSYGSKDEVEKWVDELANDAQFNFGSYAECFISENLIRKYIEHKKIAISPESTIAVNDYKKREKTAKEKGNISIDIRSSSSDLLYLDMASLAALVDNSKEPLKEASLKRDSWEYKPMRDAMAHTALLSQRAKVKLNSVYENIKGRVRTLLEKM